MYEHVHMLRALGGSVDNKNTNLSNEQEKPEVPGSDSQAQTFVEISLKGHLNQAKTKKNKTQ